MLLTLLTFFIICFSIPYVAVAGSSQECVDASNNEMQGEVYIGTAEDGYYGLMQVKPGDKRNLKLYVRKGPSWTRPNACVTWHIETPDVAIFNETSGALEVKSDAKNLATIKIHAKLLGSEKEYSGVLVVYRPEINPLIGKWHELAQLPCNDKTGGKIITVKKGIQEFEVDPTGSFSVTWNPFESYRDYWGTYQFDLKKRTVEFMIKDGNYKPFDYSGKGSFMITPEGNLKITGAWLGSKNDPVEPHFRRNELLPGRCGHIFTKDVGR